jgi:Chromo (CHRromatin Organisation MOdifier) domain
MKMWIRAQDRRKEMREVPTHNIPVQRVDVASMNEWTYLKPQISQRAVPSNGRASSSSPQSEAASSPPQSEATSSLAGSEGDSAVSDSGSEDSRSEGQDSQDEDGASPKRTTRQLHAHRFNYDIGTTELLVEWDDFPGIDSWEWVPKDDLLHNIPVMITAFLANNLPLEAELPVRFHERNSGAVGFDFLVEFECYSEQIYWTWVPESDMQVKVPDMVNEWMAENASEVEASKAEDTIDEQIVAEQNYAKNVRNDEAENNDVDEAAKEDPGHADARDADVKDEDAEESTAEYDPKRFVAQRDTPDGPEILVEWEDYPDEKDWTWEPVGNLQEDAPEMVKAWKASRKAKKVFKVYEVESILGKRKIQGEWHYRVKWKGFSKDEATSLEPCEKLALDVPDLVKAFESRKPRRGKPKKIPSA